MNTKRKRIRTVSSFCMVAVLSLALLLQGCGKKDETKDAAEESGKKTSITLLNNKGEVAEQMTELAKAYNASQNKVEITIETVGVGTDYLAMLRGLYLADKMPDIFACEASHFSRWEGLLCDMSGEDWVKDTDSAYVDPTYGTLGFPYTTEAIGLAYNADMLEKAGIDPNGLTSPEAYATAFAKLDAMKGELGLDAVVAYSTDMENLSWSTGNHIFGAYLDAGLKREDTTYIDLLNDKETFDNERLLHYAEFIGMLNRYANPSLLVSGDQDKQVEGFASGKYAFMTQGSWTGAMLTGDYADAYKASGNFKVGMAPYAFEEGIDTIMTNTPAWWAVAKEGHVKAANDFLNWCAGNEGQKILVESAGFVSPFKSCSYIANDPFAQTIVDHVDAGKTSAWHRMDVKPWKGERPAAQVFYDYANGSFDAAGFVTAMQAAFEAYFK